MTKAKFTQSQLNDIQAQRCLGAVMGYTTREQWKKYEKFARQFGCSAQTVYRAVLRANNGKHPREGFDDTNGDGDNDVDNIDGESDDEYIPQCASQKCSKVHPSKTQTSSASASRDMNKCRHTSSHHRQSHSQRFAPYPTRCSSSSKPSSSSLSPPPMSSTSSASSRLAQSQVGTQDVAQFLRSLGLAHLQKVFSTYGFTTPNDLTNLKSHSARTKEIVLRSILDDGSNFFERVGSYSLSFDFLKLWYMLDFLYYVLWCMQHRMYDNNVSLLFHFLFHTGHDITGIKNNKP
ncbi:hypothetical protein C8Q75DRAFT_232727 [Abortiporus biennis]|nr:hypothetical protein C8Q75DRAFT_232727 [Abortiporus biennis]